MDCPVKPDNDEHRDGVKDCHCERSEAISVVTYQIAAHSSGARNDGESEMKNIFKKFEDMMAAAAFAEEGEFDTARQIMKESESRKTKRPVQDKRRKSDKRKELRAD